MRTTVTILDLNSEDFIALKAAGEDLTMFSPEAMAWYIRSAGESVRGTLRTGQEGEREDRGADGDPWTSHGFKNLRMEDDKLVGDLKVYANRDGQILSKIMAAQEPVRFDMLLHPNYAPSIMYPYQKFKLIRIDAYVSDASFRRHSFKR